MRPGEKREKRVGAGAGAGVCAGALRISLIRASSKKEEEITGKRKSGAKSAQGI